MADTDHQRLSARSGRRFAWTLAAGFGALAGLLAWRDRQSLALLLASAAVLSLLSGLLFPHRLRRVEAGWMALGHAISKVTSPIIFAALYFLLLTPMGILRRWLGAGIRARRDTESLCVGRWSANSRNDANMPLMRTARELWAFMRERKKFWLMPIVFTLLALGALLAAAQGSALAPFIYSIF